MKKISNYIFIFISFFLIFGCNSTSSNVEQEEPLVVEAQTEDPTENTENIEPIVKVPSEKTDKPEQVENQLDEQTNEPVDFTEEEINFSIEEEPEEEIVQLTELELYQNFINGCQLDINQSPKQVTKNKKFATPFSVKCTKDGNPVPNMLVTVNYPVAQTNGYISFGQEVVETDENGIASFTVNNTSFSCNSNVSFYLTPETEDPETLEYAKNNAVLIPYKVITNRFYDSGVLALIDYNSANRALSTNTTATALQPPLRKAGFSTIGNAPFDAQIVTSKNLYSEAKAIFGSTVSFMIYGTVKYAEPAQVLENGEYIVTFITNFSVMNLKDGKIVYQSEFLTSETGASEWEATNKLRTKTIPEIITEKVIYGI